MGNLLCWSREREPPYQPTQPQQQVAVVDSHLTPSRPASPFSPTHLRKDIYTLSPTSFRRAIQDTGLPKCTQNQCWKMYAMKRNIGQYTSYGPLDRV